MTDIAGLYFKIEEDIRRFHSTLFEPPTGLELNAADWDSIREQVGLAGATTLQGLPVTLSDELKPGEWRLTGHEDKRAQLADLPAAVERDGHIMIGVVGRAPDLVGECSCGERMEGASIDAVSGAHATHRLLTADNG
jgi:hypothetical protein